MSAIVTLLRFLYICLLLICLLLPFVSCQDYPSANIGSKWINDNLTHNVLCSDGSLVRARLLRSSSQYAFTGYALGFFCNGTACTNNQYMLSVFIVSINSGAGITYVNFPYVVWTANRDRLVGENATLELGSDGDLVLKESDGTFVWSTNTSQQSVAYISIERSGNLVLLDKVNNTVWQSFDHPTIALPLNQQLKLGMRLTARVSSSNYSEAPYYLEMQKTGLVLYAKASQPQAYWTLPNDLPGSSNLGIPFAQLKNDSLGVYLTNTSDPDTSISLSPSDGMKFLYVEYDGRLKVQVCSSSNCSEIVDLLSQVKKCVIAGTCGPYGYCTDSGCSCLSLASGKGSLSSDSFRPIKNSNPEMGCNSSNPVVCNSTTHFVQMSSIDYFSMYYSTGSETNIDGCQKMCEQNCSCKASFLLFGSGPNGTCYTITEVYTLRSIDPDSLHYNVTALIRMQTPSSSPVNQTPPSSPDNQTPPSSSGSNKTPTIVGLAVGLPIFGAIITSVVVALILRRRQQRLDKEEDYFESVPGLPTRFMYKELYSATENFSKKLGAGGFGSVFLGALSDGTHVAIKRLESANQGQKEFRTEVCIIGSIHHFNLVHLCGFCCEKGHKMLVYDYMPNGSLDQWLFGEEKFLDWDTRFKIALGTARGLAYLHEECRETIIHLDIKPQNILLDEHFDAKVADFGLSKLMNRDQSQVMTQMRGTPGYLAPEWLHGAITSKTDVYSYGVLLLEVVSGHKSLDLSSQDSEKVYFPKWASKKFEVGEIMDLVDGKLGELFNKKEAERAIKVAFWCIQEDPEARPNMITVVQMLEGLICITMPPLNFAHSSHPPLPMWNDSVTSEATPFASAIPSVR